MFNASRRGATSLCRLINAPNYVQPTTIKSRIFLESLAFPKIITRSVFSATKPSFYRDDGEVRGESERGGECGGRGVSRRGRGGFKGGRDSHDRPARSNRFFEDKGPDELLEGTREYVPKYTTFQELANEGLVHASIIREITEGMGHHTMTAVQAQTISETVEGSDAIAQARTGTGKTLGFLIPTINNILKTNPELGERTNRYTRAQPSDIRAIIISPTRELAEQIGVEARKLTRSTGLVTQVAVGGTGKREFMQNIRRQGCHILVATPGRLHDLLTDPYSRVAAPALKSLVLDEADRLLDDGFSEAIKDIIDCLPPRDEVDRQTLLFSATVPRDVMTLVKKTLKPGFHFVQTVKAGEQATHEKIPQYMVSCVGLENMMPTLLELSKRGLDQAKATQESPPFKAIVYFSSTAGVELAAAIFRNLGEGGSSRYGSHPLRPAEISEMHGTLTQAQRQKVSDRFRRATSGIMFSTDVTARGMDFPGVTHVIQCGLPPNREQYIHRVGRTGRGDKGGEGWIIMAQIEAPKSRVRLQGLPLIADTSLEAAKVDMTKDAQLSPELATTLTQIGEATQLVDRRTKVAAWTAQFTGFTQIREKQRVVHAMNQWSRYGFGFEQSPALKRGTITKNGFSQIKGLNIADAYHDDEGGAYSPRSGSGSFSGRRDDRGFSAPRGGRVGFSDDRRGGYDRPDRFSRERY